MGNHQIESFQKQKLTHQAGASECVDNELGVGGSDRAPPLKKDDQRDAGPNEKATRLL